ncbi:flippase-like domain-containing protein [Actinomadura darangshiensis]|uniref:Flippase-like domain-containing protein n=1 Tax=Actinomadura darangshiensis TaxID=705336 RepID=A0A4R5B394_9ACTN|nr:lysylphosphatidylglycerol synthase transmembrane domain-containing protein [Actinomadura darangshiensis]TDD78034.1 flippase-like domain-containing protein [Actinomadura darangshiensis]
METIAAPAETAASAKLAGHGAHAPTLPFVQRPRRGRGARWPILGVLITALVAAGLAAFGPLRPAAAAIGDMRWALLPVLIMLSLLHYVCSAVALRGASGRPLPLVATTMAQFTASAANRVTPGGLGAVAVNTRYLVCRGVPLPRAAVAVAVLQVAGLPADLLLMGAVLGLGTVAPHDGNDRMLDALGHHATQAAGVVPPVPLLIAGGVLLPAAVLWGRRAVRSGPARRAAAGFADLCRRPRDLVVTLAASAGTTFAMGVAFAVSAVAIPGTGVGPTDALALIAAYLVGAAAGSAIPTPGGVGSTEAALVAALAALGIAAGPALHAVLLFRAVTFWAPVPLGVLACRTLRR